MEANKYNAKGKPRREPFCWQEKATLRMITDVYSASGATARSVYVAMTEIASDRKSDVYDASHPEIAHRAGTSVSSVQRVLPTLVKLGCIKIRRNSINGIQIRSTYTIIRSTPVHYDRASVQVLSANLPTEEECTKNVQITARMKSNRKKKALSTSLADGRNSTTGDYEW
jgi:DNA-binding IscR family transcriptional regulator